MLHSTSVDPFELALYKLMGKLDPCWRLMQRLMEGLIVHLRWACTPQVSTLVDDKQIMVLTDLVPLGDVARINRRVEEFKELHNSLQRNLHTSQWTPSSVSTKSLRRRQTQLMLADKWYGTISYVFVLI